MNTKTPAHMLWDFVLEEFVEDEGTPFWLASANINMSPESSALFAPPLPLDAGDIPF